MTLIDLSRVRPAQRELILPVILDESEGISLIRIDGDVDIAMAAEMKNLLVKALASGKDLHISMAGATELDVTALQLLYAADREAAKSGVRLTLDDRVPEEIFSAMTDGGFTTFHFQL
jgi:anti-anti-sigma regulatory factor